MQPMPRLDESVSPSGTRVASAALQVLNVATDLLAEAARTLGAGTRAGELQDAVAAISSRIPRLEDSESGVADSLFVAREIVHLCDVLASRHRWSSPAALGCATLAEAGAHLALEALTEKRGWTGAEALSRRARQIGEIQDLQRRLDDMAAALELHGVEGTAEGRSFRGDLRRVIDGVDPSPA